MLGLDDESDYGEEDSLYQPKTNYLKWIVITVIVGVVIFLMFSGKVMNIPSDYFWFGSFLVFLWFMKSSWTELKHRTAKIICNPIYSTTDGYYEPVGDFAIFKLGVIKAGSLHMPYKSVMDGLLIVPRLCITSLGKSVACNVRAEPWKLDELPDEIQSWIVSSNLQDKPIFVGLANESQYNWVMDIERNDKTVKDVLNELKRRGLPEDVTKPNVSYLIRNYRDVCKQNTELRRLKDIRMSDIQKAVEQFGRIRDSAQRTGMVKSIYQGMIRDRPKEEER